MTTKNEDTILKIEKNLSDNGLSLISQEDWAILVRQSNQIQRKEWEDENNPKLHYSDNSEDVLGACTEVSMTVISDNLKKLSQLHDIKVNPAEVFPVSNTSGEMLIATKSKIEDTVRAVSKHFKDAVVKKLSVERFRHSFDDIRMKDDAFGGLENVIYPSHSQWAGEKGCLFGDIGYQGEQCDYTGWESDFVSAYSDFNHALLDELQYKYYEVSYVYTDFCDTALEFAMLHLKADVDKFIEENTGSYLRKETLAQAVADTMDIIPFKGNKNNLPENYDIVAKTKERNVLKRMESKTSEQNTPKSPKI